MVFVLEGEPIMLSSFQKAANYRQRLQRCDEHLDVSHKNAIAASAFMKREHLSLPVRALVPITWNAVDFPEYTRAILTDVAQDEVEDVKTELRGFLKVRTSPRAMVEYRDIWH